MNDGVAIFAAPLILHHLQITGEFVLQDVVQAGPPPGAE